MTRPTGLWQPGSGVSLPESGNYVYLESESGDYIGAGQTNLYTAPTSPVSLSNTGGNVSVTVDGWDGEFQTMSALNFVKPGYYGELHRSPFHNPAKGGLDWSGQGRGCNTLTGWFVVDSVTYVGATMTSIDIRFEQHCEGQTPALRGKIRWSS